MKGTVTQTLEQEYLIDIVQHYYDNVVYAEGQSPVVQEVTTDGAYPPKFTITTVTLREQFKKELKDVNKK